MENERLANLIDAIKNEKPVDAETHFKDEMKDRLKAAFDARRLELAKSLFAKTDGRSELEKILTPEE